jgi:hypothetical protein
VPETIESLLAAQGDICGLETLPPSLGLNLVLAAGLLTGMSHCVGMCGPLVGAFAAARHRATGDLATPLVVYQLGRLGSYTLIGLLMGSLGTVVRALVVGLGWQGRMSIAFGLLVVVAGLGLLGWLPFIGHGPPGPLRLVGGFVSRGVRRLLVHPHPLAPLALGLLNGLLPCGAVYAMAGLAAVSGDPLRGALIMMVFGLGTLPAMLAVGLFASALGLKFRAGLYRAAGLVVVVLGLQMVLRGLAAGGYVNHQTLGGIRLW